MLSLLITLSLSVEYRICFYNADSKVCPDGSETISITSFSDFNSKSYPNSTSAKIYVFTDITSVFPIGKFQNGTLNFYGDENKYKILFEKNAVAAFKNQIYVERMKLQISADTEFINVILLHTTVIKEDGAIVTPLKAKKINVDTRSLVGVGAIHADDVEVAVPYFASNAKQSFYIHGKGSLRITKILDGPTISFYGDSIVVHKEVAYCYINTAFWYGSISINQPHDTNVNLQYLMANMTLKNKVINYQINNNSLLAFSECIWPSLDRVRINLEVKEKSTIILSAINIPLFITGPDNGLNIITNSSELTIPALNTSIGLINISSATKTPTVFTIGTIYIISKMSSEKIIANDPNTIIITQILGKDKIDCHIGGQSQWALRQFPPTTMSISISNLNTLYGAYRYVIPISMTEGNGKLTVGHLNGPIKIYPNIIGNPTIEEINKNPHSMEIFECIEGLNNVTIEFNLRGLRGFTEGTNIYESSTNGNIIVIKRQRSIDEVNDKFCIALNESFCPSDYTWIEDKDFKWDTYADHEIAEMTFAVYNTTDIVLDFHKFDKPVVNFIGYNDANISITGDSLETNISYLVARNISFRVIGGPSEFTLGYSANLRNVKFDVPFLFVDDETYNFVSDVNSFPTEFVTSHYTTLIDFPITSFTLNNESIVLDGDKKITLKYDPSIGTHYQFIFTNKTSKSIFIQKASGTDSIPYQIDILAEKGVEFIESLDVRSTIPIIRFMSFDAKITINTKEPPISFTDLLDNAVINLNQDYTHMKYLFDASAKIKVNGMSKHRELILSNVIMPSVFEWKLTDVDIQVVDGFAIGGPSHYDDIRITGNLTFFSGPALSIKDLNESTNASLVIPYSFNAMPQINFTSKTKINIRQMIMKFVPPIDENVFVHRNIKLYEDSKFDVLCGNFSCDAVQMIYISDIKYFNGDLCAFVKQCVQSPEHGTCLRLWFDSERDPIDDGGKEDKKKTKMTNIIIGVVCAVIVVIIAVVVGVFQYKKRIQEPESLTSQLISKSQA